MHPTLKATVAATCISFAAVGFGQGATNASSGTPAGRADPLSSPIFGVTIPSGYRQWEIVAPSQETGALDELRTVLGNPLAIKAYREGALPFPDGTVLAKLAWKRAQSSEFSPAYVPGAATTVQFMVKDSKKYASTGGWGFGRFIDGKPADEAQHQTCFACHAANVKGHDFVFTRLAP
ncbi:MAG: cytochrome P460 family protein [Chitinophagaceae bacterium]|nr:cytochrome P460 family protein [Rubrivivax sp.]